MMEDFEIYEFESLSGKQFDELIQSKINYVLSRVLSWYPNKVIESLNKNHRKFAEGTLVKTRRLAGYPDDNKVFFEDFGFVYINKNSINSENKKTRDNIKELIENNPTLYEYFSNSNQANIFMSEKNIFSDEFKIIFENLMQEKNLNYTIADLYYYYGATEFKEIENFASKTWKIYEAQFAQNSAFYKKVFKDIFADLLYLEPIIEDEDDYLWEDEDEGEDTDYSFLKEFVVSDLSKNLTEIERAKYDKVPVITDYILKKAKNEILSIDNVKSPRLTNESFLNILTYKNFIDMDKKKILNAIEVQEDFDWYHGMGVFGFNTKMSCGTTEFKILKLTKKGFDVLIDTLKDAIFDFDTTSKLKATAKLIMDNWDWKDIFKIKIKINDCEKYFNEEYELTFDMNFHIDCVKRVLNDYYVLVHYNLIEYGTENLDYYTYSDDVEINIDRLFVDCLRYYNYTKNEEILNFFDLNVIDFDTQQRELKPSSVGNNAVEVKKDIELESRSNKQTIYSCKDLESIKVFRDIKWY